MTKTKILYTIGFVFALLCAVAVFLGFKFSRISEALIVSAGILAAYISIILFDGYLSKREYNSKISAAGNQIIRKIAFCKHMGVCEQVVISFHTRGVLVEGEKIESNLLEYDCLLVDKTKEYTFVLMYDKNDFSETYQITVNTLLDVKAIVQVLKNYSIEIGGI